jgi:hypothetical protein
MSPPVFTGSAFSVKSAATSRRRRGDFQEYFKVENGFFLEKSFFRCYNM